jgi:hypothetical protein
MWVCKRCGTELDSGSLIGRNSTCPSCNAYLHSCVNCRFYSPGRHNDCTEPQAELVRDKRSANFCDYFVMREGAAKKAGKNAKSTTRDAFDRLFGSDPP